MVKFLIIPVIILACLAAPLAGLLRPECNWDMLAYDGIVKVWQGGKAYDAYADARDYCEKRGYGLWAQLTTATAYRRAVYADPKVFEKQLPLYDIRPLYLLAVRSVSRWAGNVALATLLVSVAAVFLSNVLVSWFALRRAGLFFGGCMAAAYTLAPANFAIVGLSTPDALAVLTAAAAFVAFCMEANIAGALVLAAGTAVRTDMAVLNCVLGLMFILSARKSSLLPGLILLSTLAIAVLIGHLTGNYGYRALYHIMFVEGPSPDPSLYTHAAIPPMLFIKRIAIALFNSFRFGTMSPVLLLTLSFGVLLRLRKIADPERMLFAALLATYLIRLVVFPAYDIRYAAPMLAGMTVVLISAVGKLVSRRASSCRPSP